MMEHDFETPAADEFFFWQPPDGMTLSVGAAEDFQVPEVPLPLLLSARGQEPPPEKLIGDSLYEYLRRFPQCQYAPDYARILQNAFPFLIADVGSQLILLDARKVGPAGLEEKIALLMILNHLESDNFGLAHKLGRTHFDLALHYSELSRTRVLLKEARSWLERARRIDSSAAENLSILGQVCYLNGAYHQARLYWQIAFDQTQVPELHDTLQAKLARIEAGNLPQQPLLESLEQLATAREHSNRAEYPQAREILENLEAVGDLGRELPNPEFYALLGLARESCVDLSGAFEAYSTALQLDNDNQTAQQGLQRVKQ